MHFDYEHSVVRHQLLYRPDLRREEVCRHEGAPCARTNVRQALGRWRRGGMSSAFRMLASTHRPRPEGCDEPILAQQFDQPLFVVTVVGDGTLRRPRESVVQLPVARIAGPCGPVAGDSAVDGRGIVELSPRFDELYSALGRPSIPPAQLLRALLLQTLYTIRSERLLMEEIDYSILFR